MTGRRVVITGMGVISPIGNSLDEFWSGLISGVSGVGPTTHFDTSKYLTKIAAEVKGFQASDYMQAKIAKRHDRCTHFAVAAAKQAMAMSGLDMNVEDPEQVGVAIGSGIGGLQSLEENKEILDEKGPDEVSPYLVLKMISNMPAGVVSIETKAQGANLPIVTACATGNHCIGEAWHIIKRGETIAMLAGGTEAAIQPISTAAFNKLSALSIRNDEPTKASRPYDKDRDGFVMGEGSGVLVLEELEHAKQRGATIYAEIVGYGMSADADSEVLINPRGAISSMRKALLSAGLDLTPWEIDYINTHGTSTPLGDRAEIRAIKEVFEHRAEDMFVSSTKSMTGHLLGAAGAIEAIACVMANYTGIKPATINLENLDPECEGVRHITKVGPKTPVMYTMNNSFGFGGPNATTIFKRYDPELEAA